MNAVIINNSVLFHDLRSLRYIAVVDMSLLFYAFETCFASNSVFITSRSFTAPQALLQLQDISADCSDGKDSNSEIDDVLDNDLEEV